MLVWPYRPIHLLNVHFSRFDMLTPNMGIGQPQDVDPQMEALADTYRVIALGLPYDKEVRTAAPQARETTS